MRATSYLLNIWEGIKTNKWRQLALLLILQGLLMLVGFNKIITAPEETVFKDDWDGVKNYYTYVWYVSQPDSVPYKLFTGMNYPYNEYFYYTDNTPIVAVAVRWVHLNVVDLSNYFMAIYHWVMFLSMWLSTLLLFLILRKLGLPALWVLLGSLMLAWLHPQILKFSFGCYNLAFTWAQLSVFYGLLHLHGHMVKRTARKAVLWSLFLALAVTVSALCHLYYLPLLLLWIAFYLGVMVVYQLAKRQVPWLPVASGLLIAGISAAVCFGMIMLTDEYYAHRLTVNAGYGHRDWILNYKDLFAPNWFNSLQFIFHREYSGASEGHSYLGAAALYGWLMVLISAAWNHYQRRQWPRLLPISQDKLFWFAIGFGAISLTFIALSEHIETSKDNYLTNYLNIFYYLRPHTDSITQFRALGRFVWPLFWVVNFMLLWYLAKRMATIPKIVVVVVFTLMGSDTVDMLRYYNIVYRANPFAETQLETTRETFSTINISSYQALLPIPYYHVGSDNYDITMDPERVWARESMQLSMAWKMPLMATQLARTANYQAINLTGMFQTGTLAVDMVELMDSRPVLIIIKKSLTNPCATAEGVPSTWAIDVCALPLVFENEAYQLYKWQPKAP